jgi:hypothetical protein
MTLKVSELPEASNPSYTSGNESESDWKRRKNRRRNNSEISQAKIIKQLITSRFLLIENFNEIKMLFRTVF